MPQFDFDVDLVGEGATQQADFLRRQFLAALKSAGIDATDEQALVATAYLFGGVIGERLRLTAQDLQPQATPVVSRMSERHTMVPALPVAA